MRNTGPREMVIVIIIKIGRKKKKKTDLKEKVVKTAQARRLESVLITFSIEPALLPADTVLVRVGNMGSYISYIYIYISTYILLFIVAIPSRSAENELPSEKMYVFFFPVSVDTAALLSSIFFFSGHVTFCMMCVLLFFSFFLIIFFSFLKIGKYVNALNS